MFCKPVSTKKKNEIKKLIYPRWFVIESSSLCSPRAEMSLDVDVALLYLSHLHCNGE